MGNYTALPHDCHGGNLAHRAGSATAPYRVALSFNPPWRGLSSLLSRESSRLFFPPRGRVSTERSCRRITQCSTRQPPLLVDPEHVSAGIAEPRRDLRRVRANGRTISHPLATIASTVAAALSTMIEISSPGSAAGGRLSIQVPLTFTDPVVKATLPSPRRRILQSRKHPVRKNSG